MFEGLNTLYDMLKFYAEKFYHISHALENWKHFFERYDANEKEIADATLFDQFLEDVVKRSVEIDLIFSANKAQELRLKLKNGLLSYRDVRYGFTELSSRIQDELTTQMFLWVAREDNRMGTWPEEWKVILSDKRFGDSEDDIRDAAKALTVGDYTGAVFHLMRTMECAFDLIAKTLGITFPDKREWGGLLASIEQHFQKKHKVQNDKWTQHEPEWTSILADLRSVKNAWRNKVIHKDEMAVDRFYEPKTAKKIYSAVQDFTQNLSERVH